MCLIWSISHNHYCVFMVWERRARWLDQKLHSPHCIFIHFPFTRKWFFGKSALILFVHLSTHSCIIFCSYLTDYICFAVFWWLSSPAVGCSLSRPFSGAQLWVVSWHIVLFAYTTLRWTFSTIPLTAAAAASPASRQARLVAACITLSSPPGDRPMRVLWCFRNCVIFRLHRCPNWPTKTCDQGPPVVLWVIVSATSWTNTIGLFTEPGWMRFVFLQSPVCWDRWCDNLRFLPLEVA